MSRRRWSGTTAKARGRGRDRDDAVVGWTAWRRRWLRDLGAVKRELAHERFPRSAGQGLGQVAALSEMGLSLLGRRRPARRA